MSGGIEEAPRKLDRSEQAQARINVPQSAPSRDSTPHI